MTVLTCHQEQNIRRLRLSSDSGKNALNCETCDKLARALEEAAAAPDCRAVLLESEGAAFCSGLDLGALTGEDGGKLVTLLDEALLIGANYPKPIVAAVQGPAIGAALALLANCHVVVAAQGTQFALTEIRYGYWPFAAQRALAQAVGARRALELSLTGRVFSAAEALSIGLIHEVVQPVELDDRATATAHLLADWSPSAVTAGLRFSANPCGSGEAALELLASPDLAEGLLAQQERRKPIWPSQA